MESSRQIRDRSRVRERERGIYIYIYIYIYKERDVWREGLGRKRRQRDRRD